MPFLSHSLKLSNLSLIVSVAVLDIWVEEELRHSDQIKAVVMRHLGNLDVYTKILNGIHTLQFNAFFRL